MDIKFLVSGGTAVMNYDCGEEDYPAVAGFCRNMKYRSSAGGERESYGGMSCNMCSHWDGRDCRKKVLHSLLSRYE